MGLSNKKTTKTETSTATQDISTTRTNPAYVTDALKGYTDKVTGLLGDNPADFVAPANSLQTQAGASAAGLGGWKGGLDAATANIRAGIDTATPQVGASSLLDGLDKYMNPILDKVVNTTLGDFDVDAGRTRAAQAASGARNGAFGGSRFGVREAQTEGELSRAREAADANLRYDAFDKGAALSADDAGRRQQAALANQSAAAGDLDRRVSGGGLMGNLALAGGDAARADAGTQFDVGAGLRGIDTEQRQAPLGLLGAVGDLLGKGQFELTNGTDVHGLTNTDALTKVNESPGLMSKIGQAIQTAAAAAALSDMDLKTDVVTLGHDDRGRRWVSWRYLWEAPDTPRHTGVMAQEVRATDPDAVVVGPMGFLMVDYSKLEGTTWRHS